MRLQLFPRPLLLASLLAAVGAAQAGTVTVLTSFPKELTGIYKKAFEDKHPGIKIEILNKNTTASIAYIKELPAGQRPDVMWASAPDAFEVLARDKLLQTAPEVVNPATPAKIGNYPINDPGGMYYGQALAGYGMMWNTRYMAANKLPAPKEWMDLARGEYFGHVAISSPSRSGTTHLTVETILQGEGWDKGWSQLLEIMGNAAAVTDRSFAVPDGVNNGQYGIGIVIDFFGLAGKYSGFPVDFAYPAMTAVVPANIALIAGGIAVASIVNARLVVKLGSRKISHTALIGFTSIAAIHAVVAISGHESIWTFAVLQTLTMFCFGLIAGNFGAMAMETMGHIAGTAASIQGFISTVFGSLLGFAVGQQFNGTTVPMSLGFTVFGLTALAYMWAQMAKAICITEPLMARSAGSSTTVMPQ